MPSANTMFDFSGQAPHSSFVQTPSPAGTGADEIGFSLDLKDGTPFRVATVIILVVLGLAGLRWANFRFNVTSG